MSTINNTKHKLTDKEVVTSADSDDTIFVNIDGAVKQIAIKDALQVEGGIADRVTAVEGEVDELNSNLAKKVNVNHPNITGVLWNKDITTGNTQVINAGGDTMIVGNTSIKLHLESNGTNKAVDDLITKPKIIGGVVDYYPYTCTVDGFAMITMKAWYDQTLPLDGAIYLNGEVVAEDYFTFTFQTLCATIPIKVGDVITCTNGFNFSLRILC